MKPAGEYLRGLRVVFARELEAYFDSPIAYVFATVFLALSCSVFMNGFFLAGLLDMGAYFEALPFLLILFIPAMTMRAWAEEKAQGTFELVMTLPLASTQILLGKYLASMAFYCLVLAGSLPLVLMLLALGSPDLGLIASSYLGALALGALFLAFGTFGSALTADQIVAFVTAAVTGCLFVLTGQAKVVEVLDGLTPHWQLGTWLYDSVSVMPHYASFTRGVVSLPDVVYFALMSAFFLWMTELTLRRSKH
jgi:ABC-2 type transport system permease protein